MAEFSSKKGGGGSNHLLGSNLYCKSSQKGRGGGGPPGHVCVCACRACHVHVSRGNPTSHVTWPSCVCLQCATHLNLGWRIRVNDPGTSKAAVITPSLLPLVTVSGYSPPCLETISWRILSEHLILLVTHPPPLLLRFSSQWLAIMYTL